MCTFLGLAGRLDEIDLMFTRLFFLPGGVYDIHDEHLITMYSHPWYIFPDYIRNTYTLRYTRKPTSLPKLSLAKY